MDLAKMEARLKSDDVLERNLAVSAVLRELKNAYQIIEDMTEAIMHAMMGDIVAKIEELPAVEDAVTYTERCECEDGWCEADESGMEDPDDWPKACRMYGVQV